MFSVTYYLGGFYPVTRIGVKDCFIGPALATVSPLPGMTA